MSRPNLQNSTPTAADHSEADEEMSHRVVHMKEADSISVGFWWASAARRRYSVIHATIVLVTEVRHHACSVCCSVWCLVTCFGEEVLHRRTQQTGRTLRATKTVQRADTNQTQWLPQISRPSHPTVRAVPREDGPRITADD